MPTNEEIIDEFCGYFYDQIESIRAITYTSEESVSQDIRNYQIRFYKKALLITALDTLAGIRFPKKRFPSLHFKNRDRFKTFLAKSRCWDGGELVSIPFLAEQISKGKNSNSLLNNYVTEILKKHKAEGSFNIPFRALDQPTDALFELAATELEEKAILECQHYELMYRYRNYLIHESREPGGAMEIFPDESEPYYHGYIGQDALVLAYPLELFVKIMKKSVDYITQYLKAHKLNPYDFVEKTTRW